MRLVEQFAESGQVAGAQGRDGLQDTLVLGDDVPRPPPQRLGQRLDARQVGDPQLAQQLHAEQGAGAIVVHTADDRLSGVVNETALLATPEDRRPWQPISSVARTMEDGLVLPVDIFGEDLVRAMSRTPAGEYVLVEQDGKLRCGQCGAPLGHLNLAK